MGGCSDLVPFVCLTSINFEATIDVVEVKTKRLTLRAFADFDYDTLVVLMTDPEVMKFTGFKTPQTPERIRELLEKWKSEGIGPLGVWAAEERDSGEVIGWCMLKTTRTETPELGYMIVKTQWGKGYASEIAKSLVQYAEKILKLPRIVAVTSPDNVPSMRVLEKAGMTIIHAETKDDSVWYERIFKLLN